MEQTRVAQLFLNLGHAFDHLFMLIFPTVVLAMTPEFGLSYSEMLPLSLGGFIMFGACSLPAGWLADRWSRRGMMVVFFTGIGAASMLTGLAGSTFQIGLGLTLIGVFGAIYHPVGIAMLVSGREKVGRVLGVNGVYGNFGVALAALIAGALAYWINWRAAFLIPGALSVAVGVAFAMLVPPVRKMAQALSRAGGVAISRNTLLRVFTILTVATMCGGVIFNATTVAMPKIFDERLTALTQTTLGIGVLVSLVYAFAAMAQLVVGYLIDRHPLRNVFVPVVAVQAPLLFLAGSMENYAMLLVALAMMFFVFGQIPINDAMVAAYTDEKWRSRAFAVRYVISFGASACSVPLVAYVYARTGDFKYLFYVLAAMSCVMIVAAICMPPQVQKRAAA
ncbi:MAG: MFS transporter [Betaproteobacteria bacterium]|nr:MFS transporter [Betaproteobacteria bacterium]MBI3054877.1 MFS transporter [Betaproteobacteria bacterium]